MFYRWSFLLDLLSLSNESMGCEATLERRLRQTSNSLTSSWSKRSLYHSLYVTRISSHIYSGTEDSRNPQALYPIIVILIVAMKASPIDDMSSWASRSYLTARSTSTRLSGNGRSIMFAPASFDVESSDITLSAGEGVRVHLAETSSLKQISQ